MDWKESLWVFWNKGVVLNFIFRNVSCVFLGNFSFLDLFVKLENDDYFNRFF